MDKQLFVEAQNLYKMSNFQGACDLFKQCMASRLEPGELGLINHQIGNCLIKLKNVRDAIAAYEASLNDPAYEAAGSVNYNLGMAYASICDFNSAIRYFDAACSSASYATPYKALMAKGNALLKLGKTAEAGAAFREAALDVKNPDPVKALMSLGGCFSEMGRPMDAARSYESAMQFPSNAEQSGALKIALAQAYVAANAFDKALPVFESAIAAGVTLSTAAQADYAKCTGAAGATPDVTQVFNPALDYDSPVSNFVDAYNSGYMEATGARVPYNNQYDAMPMDYQQAVAGGSQAMPLPQQQMQIQQMPQMQMQQMQMQQMQQQIVPAQQPNDPHQEFDDKFFGSTDAELEAWSRKVAKQERKSKNVGIKILIAFLLLILIALGAGIYLYSQGYGYPSQETVITELFANVNKDASATGEALNSDVFLSGSNGVSTTKIKEYYRIMIKDADPEILGMNKTVSSTEAFVKATNSQGGSLTYRVILSRDLIGWKVYSVELYVYSQN